jgi:hypothetical protein
MTDGLRVTGQGEPMTFSATMRPTDVPIARRIDFYRLPRPVQDRFAAATRSAAPPAPLLFQAAPRSRAWIFVLLGALGALAASALLLAGWGDPSSPLALHGPNLIVLDAILWTAAAYGVVHAMAILRALDVLPYKTGTYLFPGCLVEALGPILRVWSVGDAEAIQATASPARVELHLRDGSRASVLAPNAEAAERAQRALEQMRGPLARALAEEDPHVLAELDPLHTSALSSPIGPTEGMRYSLPLWTRFDYVVATVAGVTVGLLLATTRNSMSDDAMYRVVTATATVPAYQLYLAQGGRHASEIRDVLLPRAELQAAIAQGSVEAVQSFQEAHPTSKIGPEVDAALRQALLVELDKARKVGTMGALDAFTRKYPDNGLAPELKAARHVLYTRALDGWKAKAHADAPTTAFMDRLFAWIEKSGSSACEVRFRLKPPKLLDDADKYVMKSNHYAGPDALPSRYVTTEAMRSREQRITADLVSGFAGEVPSDVVALRAGEPLPAEGADPTNAAVLVVEYSPEWSHLGTVSLRPNTIFAGFNFTYDVRFVLPEGAPLTFKLKSWRGAELWKIKDEGITREDFEQKVYDSMFDGAFELLGKRLEETLL